MSCEGSSASRKHNYAAILDETQRSHEGANAALTTNSVFPRLKSFVFMWRSVRKSSVFACERLVRSRSRLKNMTQAHTMINQSTLRTTRCEDAQPQARVAKIKTSR